MRSISSTLGMQDCIGMRKANGDQESRRICAGRCTLNNHLLLEFHSAALSYTNFNYLRAQRHHDCKLLVLASEATHSNTSFVHPD